MSRKPDQKARGDSKLDGPTADGTGLTDEARAQLCEWLTVENLTYAKARTRLRDKFGVSTTVSALSSFFGNVALPWKYARDHKLAQTLAQLEEGKFQPAMRKHSERLAFQITTSNRVDVKTLKALVKMITDGEKIELQKQTLTLAIERFRESVKDDVTKGLEALFAEIKGNAEALALFEKFKSCAQRSIEGTKA